MGIESQFGRSSAGQEGKESREDITSDIYIYVTEHEATTVNRATKKGFYYSTPLETPWKSISYNWVGYLHPSAFERENPSTREGYSVSRNRRDDLVALAENFSLNYLERQSPELQKKGEASYRFSWQPDEETLAESQKYGESLGHKNTIRGLTQAEQKQFIEAFLKANKEAVKKQ